MKVDSTTNKFSYSTMVDDDDEHDLLAMAAGIIADESSHNSGNRADMRKSNKPIMEKRRRARINNCLNELKNILLEAMKKDPARHSKLEKADILELTVRHLQNIQRNQLAIAMATDPTVLHRFKNGFSECVTEVNRYMGRLDGAEPGVRQRLLDHLGNCVNGLQQVNPAHPAPFGSGPVSSFVPGASPCGATFPQAVPPAAALGLHSTTSPNSIVAAVTNLRHAAAAAATATHPHHHLQAATTTTVPFPTSPDDLNNNLLRSAAASAAAIHQDATSARLMSAFQVASSLPRRTLSPTPSSPSSSSLNISSSSHETTSSTPSMLQLSTSSRNDSGLSDTSDIGSSSDINPMLKFKSRLSSGGRNVPGDPIDFSIGRVTLNKCGEGGNLSDEEGGRSGGNSNVVRVVKVEPMQNNMPSPDDSSTPNKDMWRPW